MHEVRYQWNIPKIDNTVKSNNKLDNTIKPIDTENDNISISNKQRISKLQHERNDLLKTIEDLKRRTILIEERQQKLASNSIIQ